MGANGRASSTVIRMEGKEHRSPLAWLAQWMTNGVSGHSKLIFFPTMSEICSTPNNTLFLIN